MDIIVPCKGMVNIIFIFHSNKQFRAGVNDHMRMPEWGAGLKIIFTLLFH